MLSGSKVTASEEKEFVLGVVGKRRGADVAGFLLRLLGRMKKIRHEEKKELLRLAHFANSASSFPLSLTLSTLVCSEVETETEVFLKIDVIHIKITLTRSLMAFETIIILTLVHSVCHKGPPWQPR